MTREFNTPAETAQVKARLAADPTPHATGPIPPSFAYASDEISAIAALPPTVGQRAAGLSTRVTRIKPNQ